MVINAKSGAERRSYRRYPLSVRVSVQLADGREVQGRSLDICLGGLLFQPDTSGVALLATLPAHSTVGLSLRTPEHGNLMLTATLARRTPSGTGFAFAAANTAQLQQLHHLLVNPQTTRSRNTAPDPAPVQRCEAIFKHQLAILAQVLSSELQKLEQIPNAQVLLNTWQAEAQIQLQQFWAKQADEHAEDEGNQLTAGSLRLLDEGELTLWLVQVSLSQQIEQRHQAALFPLERRLSQLLGIRVAANNNPFAPTALLGALVRALKTHDWPSEQHQPVLTLLMQRSQDSLATLYAALNEVLEASGLSAAPLARKASPRKALPTPASSAPVPDGQTPVSPHGYQHFSNLMAIQEQLHAPKSAQRAVPVYTQEQLIAQLRHWEPADPMTNAHTLQEGLLEYLQQTSPSGAMPAPADSETLDLTLTAFQELFADPGFAPELRHLSRRLIAPLAQIALTDKSFFTSSSHPARRMLNTLAQVGRGWSHHEGLGANTLYGQLTRLTEQLGNLQATDPEGLERAVGDFLQYLDREQQQRELNQQRLLATQKGQERLSRAQQAVLQALNPLIGHRGIPVPVWQLLQYAWKDVLVLVQLQRGNEQERWTQGLGVVRQLLRAEPATLAALQTALKAGLQTIAFDAHRSEQLIAQACAAWATPKDYPLETNPISFPNAQCTREGDGACRVASQLQVGDWLEFLAPNGQWVQIRLAWKNSFNLSYLFVNRLGMKARECSLADLTELLRQPGTRILEREALPLVEQAMYTRMDAIATDVSISARHDALTGLANRKELELRLENLIHHAKTRDETHALAYLDLDQFRIINDLCGHTAGDNLLTEIGNILSDRAGRTGLLARIGGDEFALLLTDLNLAQATEAVEAQRQTVADYRFTWEGQHYPLHTSAGLVMIDAGSQSAQSVLSAADAACYAAKQAGRNRLHIHDIQSAASQQAQMQWVPIIAAALEHKRLHLECQPIVPLGINGHGEHFEVLLRMSDSEGRKLNPGDFLPAAERFQRMPEIDRWVVQTVLEWMQQQDSLDWLEGFSINLSGQSINDPRFLDFLLAEIRNASRINPEKLCFEATETVAIADLNNAAQAIRLIKELGCRFSLDDFGSGMSSFAYLRKLPVDYLKIDGMFIKQIDRDDTDFAFVRSIHEIAQFMGKKTIAEYVEHEAIATRLRQIGVHYAQGYYVGRPKNLQTLTRN